jgi:hypothetical protein
MFHLYGDLTIGELEIIFIKNKCLPQLPKLTILKQNHLVFNLLSDLEKKVQ